MIMNNLFPIFFKTENKSCLVIGGGKIAFVKSCQLLECKAEVTVISPEFSAEFDSILLNRIYRKYKTGDVKKFELVIAATDDENVNEQISREAGKSSIPVNVVDNPDLCSFYMGSVYQDKELKIAVSTNGKCPAFGSYIRNYIKETSSGKWGNSLKRLSVARARIYKQTMSFDSKKTTLGKLISIEEKRNKLKKQGKVFLVGAGPGDPELITLKGARVIKIADVILYDALVNPRIVFDFNPVAEKIFTGKRKGRHSIHQDEINGLMKAEFNKGKTVVRLKGGDPTIFGRGGEESGFLAENKIPFEIIPGITAGIGATTYFGIPLTMRHIADSVIFMTGHQCYGADKNDWSAIAELNSTLVIYMGLSKLKIITANLLKNGKKAETPVAVIQNGTLQSQRILVSKLKDINRETEEQNPETPALIVIGDVVKQHHKLKAFQKISFMNEFEDEFDFPVKKLIENIG